MNNRITLVAIGILVALVLGALFLFSRGDRHRRFIVINEDTWEYENPDSDRSADLEAFFHTYMDSSSLDDYVSLFKTGEAPSLSEGEFKSWKQNQKNSATQILDLHLLASEELRLGAVHYRIIEPFVMSRIFFVKYEGRNIWPVTSEQNKNFADLKNALKRIKSTGLDLVFSFDPSVSGERFKLEEFTPMLRETNETVFVADHSSARKRILSASILVNLIDRFLGSTDPKEKEFGFFLGYEKVIPHQVSPIATQFDSSQNDTFRALMELRNYTSDQIEEIQGLVQPGNMLAVASKMKELESGSSIHEYVLEIRRIYGNDAILMWDSESRKVR